MVVTRRAMFGALGALALTRAVRGAGPPQGLKVARATAFDLTSQRSKVAGKNARLDVHGDRATDRLVRLVLDSGHEGVGHCRANAEALGQLLGTDPFAGLREEGLAFVGPLGAGTAPLWDLLGRVVGKPVWALLGGKGPEKVGVYDGSIYFADLLPQYEGRWRERFREEVEMGLKDGHRAFKVKVGRGSKWMERKAGDDRDVEVVRAVREAAGPDALVGVDANNGYDLEGAKRFVDRTAKFKLAFVEEMFSEVVEECLAFKEHIASRGLSTLLADGETQGEIDVFGPFAKAKAIDVFQGDMNRFGFEGILAEAALAAPQGGLVAPHNWGSFFGYYAQLQVGRAITNFYRAEHDPLSNRVLVPQGHTRSEGIASVSDAPGLGMAIDSKAFASDAVVRHDVR